MGITTGSYETSEKTLSKDKIVALIPARGGSKSIGLKAIAPLVGLPMLSYPIRACIHSNVNETWVSTDHSKIKEVANHYGSNVLDRPESLSKDDTSIEDVILHFCESIDFDILVLVQATSPMIRSIYINEGIKLFREGNYDSVISVCEPEDMLLWSEDKIPLNYDPTNRLTRQTRKEPKLYIENGSFYIISKKLFLETKCRISGRVGFSVMPFWSSFEVDSVTDLVNIERLMK